jgi:predicted XRE-type DNA-binding protein
VVKFYKKPLFWIGSSLDDLKDCPDEVQDYIGYALHWAQTGGKSPAAKPLQGFGGAGVLEVVDDFDGNTYSTGKNTMNKITKVAIPVEASSGNIFADLGRKDAEEANARIQLAQQIAQIIERKGLNQSQAAELMELEPSNVSALVLGRLVGFSTDRLLRCLMLLGQDVDIVVRDKADTRVNAHINVLGLGMG